MSKFFSEKLSYNKKDEPKGVLSEVTVDGIVEYIKSGRCQKIVVMVGAGISTCKHFEPTHILADLFITSLFIAAGIPDFRSPGSGLYDNLQKYNLPHPQAIFDIEFFRENPEPFFQLAKSMLPSVMKPTPCHYFLKLLQEKGILTRCYTQNVDNLERVVGITDEKLVEAHGSFYQSHCLRSSCRKEYSFEWLKDKLENSNEIPKCIICEEVVKPDIVFFGEQLPKKFFQLLTVDFKNCDLLIVIGTSLTVRPFASLVQLVSDETPRLMINLTKFETASRIERLMGIGPGFQFDSEDNIRDVMMQGLCDEMCQELVRKLDWEQEFRELMNETTTSS